MTFFNNIKQVAFIDKIGGLDAFSHIICYLKPWEKIALRSVCREFNSINCIRQHTVEEYYDFFESYFQYNHARSVIQLYCRPLIDETMTFFKYHTLIKISFAEISKYPDMLQSLKYLLLFQKEFIDSPKNKQNATTFSKNIRQMEGLYVSNRKEAEPLDQFIKDVLTNYSTNNNKHFKLLFFNHCSLGNEGMIKICKTMLNSVQSYNLETMFLSNDLSLGDEAIEILFKCVEYKLPHLTMLCIRHTGISDETCNIIHDFYQKFIGDLCFCKQPGNPHFHRYPIQLSNINITFNNGVTSKGIETLNKLFYIDGHAKVSHKNECFFNTLAIATSVHFDAKNGFTLSSRFRILNQTGTIEGF